MYCTDCGSEMDPDDSFCTKCGTPAAPEGPQVPREGEEKPPGHAAAAAPPPTPPEQPPAAPTPPTPPAEPPAAVDTAAPPAGPIQQPPGPPAAAAPAPKGEKGGKKWLVGVLIGAAVAIVVALVLILTLVVFKGGGPEGVALDLYKATEKGDASAVVALVDSSELSKQEGMKAQFDKYVKQELSSGGVKFKDIKFETKIDGNNATATAVKGTITYTSESGKTATKNIAELGEGANVVYLVKRDGKWYVDTKTFSDFYATQYLKQADAALVQLGSDLQSQIGGLDSTLSQAVQGVTTFPELYARLKAVTADVDKTLAGLRRQAEDTKSKYKSVESLEGVQQYQKYANLRSQSVDVLMDMIEKLGKMLEEMSGYVSGLSANPPSTQNAIDAAKQGFDNIENSYGAQFEQLSQRAKDLESQANVLMEPLGL